MNKNVCRILCKKGGGEAARGENKDLLWSLDLHRINTREFDAVEAWFT